MEFVLIVLGLVLLGMSKAALGNRDGNAVDGMIEAGRSREDKEQNAKRSTVYFMMGIGCLLVGIVWGIWSAG